MGYSKNGTNYRIYTHLGTLGKSKAMSNLDLNVVGWYNNKPKFDLRYWKDDLSIDGKSGGGITFTLEQLRALKTILNSVDLSQDIDAINFGEEVITNLDGLSDLNEVRLKLLKDGYKVVQDESTNVQNFASDESESQGQFPWDNFA